MLMGKAYEHGGKAMSLMQLLSLKPLEDSSCLVVHLYPVRMSCTWIQTTVSGKSVRFIDGREGEGTLPQKRKQKLAVGRSAFGASFHAKRRTPKR